MQYPEHFLLGKILRTHGVKGDIIVFLDVDEPARYKKIKNVLLETNDELIEYTVTKVNLSPNEKTAIIHLSGVEDMNAAELILKTNLFQPISKLPQLKGNDFYFHEIIGFAVIDTLLGELGVIKDVYDLQQHPVGAMIYKEKEVLFPLSDETLEKIDRENKKIFVTLPDGLLEVYL